MISVEIPKWVYDDVVSRLKAGPDREEIRLILKRLDTFPSMSQSDRKIWDDHNRESSRKRNFPI